MLFFALFLVGAVALADMGITEDVVPAKNIPDMNFGQELAKMLFVLAGIIALLILTVYLLKKFSNQRLVRLNRSTDIEILERRAISPKTTLFIIKAKGRKILFAESHLKIQTIAEFKEAMSDTEFKNLMQGEKAPKETETPKKATAHKKSKK